MSITRYGLIKNPFNIIPNFNSSKPFWAGFPELKLSFEKRLKISSRIPNSSIVLNWGEYGSGKTHAAKYFTHNAILKEVVDNEEFKPFCILLNLPKGKNPIYEIYTSIIDTIDLQSLKDEYKGITGELNDYIDSHFTNKFLASTLKLIFTVDIEADKVSSFLYGNITPSELKDFRKYGIFRRIENENDVSKLLSGIFNCLIFEKKKYSNIYFWIDEFEDISLLNHSNISKVSNFIREIFDDVPTGLLILLNLTQTSFMDAEDLGQYLSDSVQSRIKQKIDFPVPDFNQITTYLVDLLDNCRDKEYVAESNLFPFDEKIIQDIFKELESSSIRRYNEKFSLLLELGDLYEKEKIDYEFYTSNRTELFGWNQ